MKKILGISLVVVFSCFVVYSQDIGGDYYVAPSGSGGSYTNPGTYERPFVHLQQAINVAGPGDTVYIRGGTYMVDRVFFDNNVCRILPEQGVGRSGIEGSPICYFNYPGEEPIFDYSLIRCDKTVSPFLTGFDISKTQWIHFRGLEFKNLWDQGDSIRVEFFGCWLVSNCTFENISVHDIGGRGYWYQSWTGFPEIVSTDTTRWINCDVFNVCDTFSTYNPGYLADGWKVHSYPNAYFSWEGCRAWHCSDDGFDMSGDGIGSWKSCWAWDQGDFNGDGNGFKIGAIRGDLDYSPRIVKNCIAAFNTIWHTSAAAGFYEPEYAVDDTAYRRVNARYYNNVAYRNGIGFYSTDNPLYQYRNSIYRNNIAYGARQIQDGVPYEVYIPYYEYEESNNSWIWLNDSWPPWHLPNPEVTVTNDDFVTSDSATIYAELAGARQQDGSLPVITAFHLADGSDLIDAGYDVGLPFNGPAPDIGAFEYEYQPGTGNRYPTVEIVSPLSGITIKEGDNIQINTIAADPDGSVAKVEFFSGVTKLGETTSEPWSFVWSNTTVGTHSLRAVVTDDKGAQSTSSAVLIIISSDNTTLYPNPNNGLFTFALTEPLSTTHDITIFSLEGRIIYKGTMLQNEVIKHFDVTYMGSGLYIFVLSGGDNYLWRKFIKN